MKYLVIAALLLPVVAWAEVDESRSWLDAGRDLGVTSGDNVAQWLDDFWGDSTLVEEAPRSKLRLRLDYSWEDGDNNDSGVSLRGKLILPKMNQRLSLLFSDDDLNQDEIDVDPEQNVLGDIYLQYKQRDDDRHRLDYKLGLTSSLALKAATKYRYRFSPSERFRGRFSEQLSFRDGEGFELDTDISFQWLLSSKNAIQLTERLKWGESTQGVEWYSGLSFNRRLEGTKSLSYFVFSRGETRPKYLNIDYGLGVKYRRSFYRPWLFYEFQPVYGWERLTPEDQRDGQLRMFFRLEMLFSDDKS